LFNGHVLRAAVVITRFGYDLNHFVVGFRHRLFDGGSRNRSL
jgi:hypothetical protein